MVELLLHVLDGVWVLELEYFEVVPTIGRIFCLFRGWGFGGRRGVGGDVSVFCMTVAEERSGFPLVVLLGFLLVHVGLGLLVLFLLVVDLEKRGCLRPAATNPLPSRSPGKWRRRKPLQ